MSSREYQGSSVESLQEATRKNLEFLRAQLYDTLSPPPNPTENHGRPHHGSHHKQQQQQQQQAGRRPQWASGAGGPRAPSAESRNTSNKRRVGEVAWLEKVYGGGGGGGAPTTTAVHVRPTSANYAPRNQREGGGGGRKVTQNGRRPATGGQRQGAWCEPSRGDRHGMMEAGFEAVQQAWRGAVRREGLYATRAGHSMSDNDVDNCDDDDDDDDDDDALIVDDDGDDDDDYDDDAFDVGELRKEPSPPSRRQGGGGLSRDGARRFKFGNHGAVDASRIRQQQQALHVHNGALLDLQTDDGVGPAGSFHVVEGQHQSHRVVYQPGGSQQARYAPGETASQQITLANASSPAGETGEDLREQGGQQRGQHFTPARPSTAPARRPQQAVCLNANGGLLGSSQRPLTAASRRPQSATSRPRSAAAGRPSLRLYSGRAETVMEPQERDDAVSITRRRQRGGDQPVFILLGPFNDVRKALVKRGWCENITAGSNVFDLKWTLYDTDVGYRDLRPHQMVNHFQGNDELTTKAGLCRSLRSSKWTLDVDTDELAPMSFDVSDVNEYDSFLAAFHASAHQGLVRMYMERSTNGTQEAFQAPGAESMVRMCLHAVRRRVLRLKRDDGGCEEAGDVYQVEGALDLFYAVRGMRRKHESMLMRRAGRGLDQAVASTEVGGTGPSCPRPVLGGTGPSCPPPSPPGGVCAPGGVVASIGSLVETCEFDREVVEVMGELKKVDPQWMVEGEQCVWIAKANSGSKAVGIKLFDSLTNLSGNSGKGRVYQKYIERPMLISGKKFDIRCWVLVTDWSQLSVWFYDTCLVRFCSDKWDLSQIKNRNSHLSNVCVNVSSSSSSNSNNSNSNANNNGTSPERPSSASTALPPGEIVWSSSQFEEYLGGRVWLDKVFPGIKQLAVDTLRTAQCDVKARKASFELYGFDIMLDEMLKPWLLEVNLSPDLRHTTAAKANISAPMVDEMMYLIVDIPSEVLKTVSSVGVRGSVEEQHREFRRCTGGVGVESGGWVLLHKDIVAAEEPRETADIRLSVEGTKLEGKSIRAWKAYESKLQDYLDHIHALTIHRLLSASLHRQRFCQKITSCALIQAMVRARPSRGRHASIAAAALRLSATFRRIVPAEYYSKVVAARILLCAARRAALDGKYNRNRSAVRLQMAWQCYMAKRRACAIRRAGQILGACAARSLAMRMISEVCAYAQGTLASPSRSRSSSTVTRRFAFWRGSTFLSPSPISTSTSTSFSSPSFQQSGSDSKTTQGHVSGSVGHAVFGVPVVWVDFVGGKTGRGAATLHAVRTWTPNRNGMACGGNILMRGAGAKGWRGGMWFLVTLQSLVRGFLARLRVRRAVAASKLASCVKASLLREGYFRLVMATLLQSMVRRRRMRRRHLWVRLIFVQRIQWRGKRATIRREYVALRSASVTLQAACRRLRASHLRGEMDAKAAQLQAAIRARLCEHVLERGIAACQLESKVRRLITWMRYGAIVEKLRRREAGGLLCAAAGRMRLREGWKEQTRAAALIQATFKRLRVAVGMWVEAGCASTIARAWRMHVATKAVRRQRVAVRLRGGRVGAREVAKGPSSIFADGRKAVDGPTRAWAWAEQGCGLGGNDGEEEQLQSEVRSQSRLVKARPTEASSSSSSRRQELAPDIVARRGESRVRAEAGNAVAGAPMGEETASWREMSSPASCGRGKEGFVARVRSRGEEGGGGSNKRLEAKAADAGNAAGNGWDASTIDGGGEVIVGWREQVDPSRAHVPGRMLRRGWGGGYIDEEKDEEEDEEENDVHAGGDPFIRFDQLRLGDAMQRAQRARRAAIAWGDAAGPSVPSTNPSSSPHARVWEGADERGGRGRGAERGEGAGWSDASVVRRRIAEMAVAAAAPSAHPTTMYASAYPPGDDVVRRTPAKKGGRKTVRRVSSSKAVGGGGESDLWAVMVDDGMDGAWGRARREPDSRQAFDPSYAGVEIRDGGKKPSQRGLTSKPAGGRVSPYVGRMVRPISAGGARAVAAEVSGVVRPISAGGARRGVVEKVRKAMPLWQD